MATVPPGPSSALPASPAESPPFTGAVDSETAREDGQPLCHRQGSLSGVAGKKAQSENEVKRSVKKKQKSMLARASPAPLHLKMRARDQPQLNGLACPPEDADRLRHGATRPDNPRSSADNCDSSNDEAPLSRNNSEDCQQEGPCSKNGSLSLSVNNSMNGVPSLPRTEGTLEGEGTGDLDGAGPVGEQKPGDCPLLQPPTEELARLDLSCCPGPAQDQSHGICYVRYESELQMPWIMRLITKDLSEPYSIYTYRYFIHNWPQLCFLAMVEQECVGAIVCKLDMHKKMFRRGYIAMLAVDSKHRRKSIGTNLVKKAIYAMVEGDCDEVVLETEITNKSALKLYENLGFVRDKRLFRYYLNGVDALRLKLWLR
ncbi:N-alpha-acetyltransferase 30 [Synchiropus picturatus]